MRLNGAPAGSVKIQSAQLPQITEFKYPGNAVQSDGYINTDVYTVWIE